MVDRDIEVRRQFCYPTLVDSNFVFHTLQLVNGQWKQLQLSTELSSDSVNYRFPKPSHAKVCVKLHVIEAWSHKAHKRPVNEMHRLQ